MDTAIPQTYKNRERQSNLELFRIIVMLLIVMHHYVVNSGLSECIKADIGSARSIWYLLLGAWGKTGINCFVFITGWFMCKSQITIAKFIKLLIEVYFYKILVFTVFLCVGRESLSLGNLWRLLSPVTGINSNFISCFFVFFLCIPFLNVLVQNISKTLHKRLVLLIGCVFPVLSLIPYYHINFNYVTWFFALYVMAAYLRHYPNSFTEGRKYTGLILCLSILLAVASVVFSALVARYWDARFAGMVYFFVSDCHKIFAVGVGISAFFFFKNLPIRQSYFINAVSATTFGILLIHANSKAMRQFLWNDLCRNADFYSSNWFWLHSLLVPLVVFVVCSVLDYVRMRYVEPLYMNFFKCHWEISV